MKPQAAKPTPHAGGRPAKFDEPRRPVTVTLPERILDRLAEIDGDRARAIVKAVEATSARDGQRRDAVDSLDLGGNASLLTVVENRFLRAIPWLRLIEIAPGRNLLSLGPGATIEKLEVALGDLLDTSSDATDDERRTIELLLERLRTPRRRKAVHTEDILVIRGK